MIKKFSRKIGTVAIVASGLCVNSSVFSQVTIGSSSAPKVGAILDMKQEENTDGSANSTKGLGLPRVALKAIDDLSPCADNTATNRLSHVGLTVYNTTDDSTTNATLKNGLYFWDGNNWQISGLTDAQGFGPLYQTDNPSLPSRNVNSNSYLDAKLVVGGTDVLGDATLSVNGNMIVDGEFILKGTQVVEKSVAIGSTAKPDPNSLLDLKTNVNGSSTKGLLLPRVSLQTLNSPLPINNTSLTEGMIVYNTNANAGAKGIYYWGDSKWNSTSSKTGSWNVANTTESATSNASNIYQMGKVGIGTNNPTAPLHIKSATGVDPIKIEGLRQGDYKGNAILTLTTDGFVRKIASSDIGTAIANETSIPVPNVYSLNQDLTNFLNGKGIGGDQVISNLKATKTAIKGMVFNESTSVLTFPAGIYQITVVYEAEHNTTGCTLSSYFVDFPTGVRIHSTAAHNQGELSNHGGSIVFTAVIPSAMNWTVKLGRGQSGNCLGPNMLLKARSTQISIFRIGEV